ncbi:unnamed protein product, partial [Closterium sp. NIES-53]
PRVSLPETSPTLCWTGKVGDALVFRVWGSRAFVRDTCADKLSARTIPSIFLGFPLDAPGWQFYHPTSRHVLPSQDVTFDESVPFYCLFTYRSARPPPPPLFPAPGPPPVDPLPPQGPAPSNVSQVDPLPGTVPVEVAGDSGAASGGVGRGGAELGGAEPGAGDSGAASGGVGPGGAEPGGAERGGPESGGAELGGEGPGGAEPVGVEPGGDEPGGAGLEGVEPGGAAYEGAESAGAQPRGTTSSGGAEPLSPQWLREWLVRRSRLQSGVAGAGASTIKDPGVGGAGVTAGAGGPGRTAVTGPGGARTGGTGAAGTGGVGGAGAGDAGAGGAMSGGPGAGGTPRPRRCFVLDLLSSPGLTPPLLCPLPDQSQPLLQPTSPLPAPSPYTKQTRGLTECREPATCPFSPVRTPRRVPLPLPPSVSCTHAMAIRPSSVPLCVPLLSPLASSLPAVLDPESCYSHNRLECA